MKNEKNNQQDFKVNPLMELAEETGRRRIKFAGKKFKGRPERADSPDEDPIDARPKLKNPKSSRSYHEEWDEDDEALFEFRRRGLMEESDDAEEDQKSDD